MGIGRTPLTAARGMLQRPPRRVWFWAGVIMLLLSFAIYPAYPLLPFLPISAWQKGAVGIALAAVSWGIFFAGSALVGKKGVAYLKHRLFWHREHPSGPDLTRGVPRRSR
jgi:VIT1/CCC1 family predicted Fe2+/Mn2+ transporter